MSVHLKYLLYEISLVVLMINEKGDATRKDNATFYFKSYPTGLKMPGNIVEVTGRVGQVL